MSDQSYKNAMKELQSEGLTEEQAETAITVLGDLGWRMPVELIDGGDNHVFSIRSLPGTSESFHVEMQIPQSDYSANIFAKSKLVPFDAEVVVPEVDQ